MLGGLQSDCFNGQTPAGVRDGASFALGASACLLRADIAWLRLPGFDVIDKAAV